MKFSLLDLHRMGNRGRYASGKCPDCGFIFELNAASCPVCGENGRDRHVKRAAWIALGTVVILVLISMIATQ